MDNGRRVTVILDGSHHGMRLLYACRKDQETSEEAYQMWRYLFLDGIFQYADRFNADEFIVAQDSKGNWRKHFFKFYKADRKLKRKAQDEAEDWFTFQEYYEQYDRLMKEIEENFPIKVLKVNGVEADDIVGVLCKSDELKDNIKVVITNDGDYIQLLSLPFVKLFNPMKNKGFVDCDSPKKELLMKIILGDKGDFVPSIKDRHIFKPEFLEYCVKEGIAKNENNAKVKLEHDEELLIGTELKFQAKYDIKPSRVMRFSKKVAKSLVDGDKLMGFLGEEGNEDLKNNFIRNNKLINLTAQPKRVQEIIVDGYNKYEIKVGLEKIFDYFVQNSFNQFLDETTKIGNILQPLCNINK